MSPSLQQRRERYALVQRLEARRLFAVTAFVDASNILQIASDNASDTIVINKLSSGQVAVSGVTPRFNPGSGAGQFNKINATGGNGNDSIQISGNVTYNTATLAGGAGNDTLTGGGANDTLSGNDGNDLITGNAGADLMTGGLNFDTTSYSGASANLVITMSSGANDGASGENDDVQTEEVICGSGNDLVTGSAFADYISGGAGNDTLYGGAGNDELVGNAGNDALYGQDGDDALVAQDGERDTVNGGTNSDGSGDLDLASIDNGLDVPG